MYDLLDLFRDPLIQEPDYDYTPDKEYVAMDYDDCPDEYEDFDDNYDTDDIFGPMDDDE